MPFDRKHSLNSALTRMTYFTLTYANNMCAEAFNYLKGEANCFSFLLFYKFFHCSSV